VLPFLWFDVCFYCFQRRSTVIHIKRSNQERKKKETSLPRRKHPLSSTLLSPPRVAAVSSCIHKLYQDITTSPILSP